MMIVMEPRKRLWRREPSLSKSEELDKVDQQRSLKGAHRFIVGDGKWRNTKRGHFHGSSSVLCHRPKQKRYQRRKNVLLLHCTRITKNKIQFNSILIYLRANLTTQGPILKRTRVRRKNNKQINAVYVVILTTKIIIITLKNQRFY
jgi:hypothetical protein